MSSVQVPPGRRSKHDPVFAAIERHRAAIAAINADKSDDVPDNLERDGIATADALVRTVPQTAVGLLAMIHYAREMEDELGLSDNSIRLDDFLSTIEKACQLPVIPADRDFGRLEGDVGDLSDMAYLAARAIEEAVEKDLSEIGRPDTYLIPLNQANALVFSVLRLEGMINAFKKRYYGVLESEPGGSEFPAPTVAAIADATEGVS